MRVRLYGRSDVGRKRTSNEDSFGLCEDEGLGVVCDGMGGHQSGEVASRTAVDLFSDRVEHAFPRLTAPRRKLSQVRSMAAEFVREWTWEANSKIRSIGEDSGTVDDSSKSRMGTTLAVVFVVGDFAVIGHVGDSRVYRIREGVIEQLTEDHVIVAESKRHPADPRPAKKRKYVTKALGTKKNVEPDISLVDVFHGDVFVLCSDGLSDLIVDDEISSMVRKTGRDYRRAIRSLIEMANQRGGHDNITVVMVEVIGEDDDDDDTEDLPILKG